MSNTYMDERFQKNDKRAQLCSYQLGFQILYFLLIFLGGSAFAGGTAFIIGAALTMAFVQFSSKYLVYHCGHDDRAEE